MKKEYSYKVIEGFTQSKKGDYQFIRYRFSEHDDFEVLVKISNPRKMDWERSCDSIDWEKCLCHIAITEGLEKQKKEIFLKEDASPKKCPWPNVQNNFNDNVCCIESADPPFGFHSKRING